MLTHERDVRTDAERLPAWARPAGAATETSRSVGRGVAVRIVGVGVVVVVLVLLGHRLGAAILLAVLALSSVLSLAVPAVGATIDRFFAGFQRIVGRGLGAVLLGLVHVVVFIPVSMVLRLLRQDPLELGASSDDPTFWRQVARPRGKTLYRRPFAYERHPAPGGRGRRTGRLRSALGVVVVLVLLDLGIGAIIGAAEDDGSEAGGDFSFPAPDVGARRHEPWAQELFQELGLHYDGVVYHPYRGWTMTDATGQHLNVANGVRRSYEAKLAGAGEPVDVYFFGGSAMMGWFQRDEHTIASELVRLAEADGIHVRALNYAQPAYDNWQELLLLEELVSRRQIPDLAVFYDGINELAPQFRSDVSHEPTHVQARETEARLRQAESGDGDEGSAFSRMVDAYSSQSAVGELVRGIRGTNNPGAAAQIFHPWPDQLQHPKERGDAAAAVHRRGVEIIRRLAASYGFRAAFVWQPWLYSKPVTAGEEAVVGSWGTDPEAWTTAGEAARAGLHDSVIDLSDVLDKVDDPVMYDFVHTNEQGARIVAEALYNHLKPTLVDLQRSAVP